METFSNNDWEKCLLSIILLDNNMLEIIRGRIDKEVFFNPVNRHFYQKICSQWDVNRIVDPTRLIDDKITPEYLANVSGAELSTSAWEAYVNNLNNLYRARQLKIKLAEASQKVTSENATDLATELQMLLAELSVSKKDAYSMKDLAVMNIEQVDQAYKNKVVYTGSECGFETLDGVIDGWNKDTMYVIGARPSIGKTAFALSILTGLAKKGVKVSMFSLEMSADSLYNRMVAAQSNIPMWQIKKGVIGSDKNLITKYLNANNILNQLPIRIFDTDIDNDKILYSKIRYEARIKGTQVVIIDHLGLIEVSNSSGQRYVDVGRITKTLHKMARELHICIVILAQCGREAEGKKPNIALLRESGNIEQDADVIMLLHRQRELDDVKENQNADFPTDVIVAKNRDGGTGTVTFGFKPLTMKFYEDPNRSAMTDGEEQKKKPYVQQENANEIPY